MPSIQLWQDSPSRRIREKKWCEPVAKPRRSCRILKGTMTIKKICSALKCQFSPAGQTLIQPLLEPKQVKASPASQGTRWFAGGDVLTAHAEIYVDAGLFMTFVTLLSARLRTKCRTFFFSCETATNSEKANTHTQIRFNNDPRNSINIQRHLWALIRSTRHTKDWNSGQMSNLLCDESYANKENLSVFSLLFVLCKVRRSTLT